MGQDEVRLAVPASPEFLRLVRVTGTGLASRLGFSFDEVEDLRLAIDELCFALIGTKGREGVLRLRYVALADGLEVWGTAELADPFSPPALTELSERILDALVDEHEVTPDGPSFRLKKCQGSGVAE